MSYWKSKVLPKIQKAFGKDPAKKAAAAEACKSFDESKEEISKEFEDKKVELEPKIVEILAATSVEIKTLVKEPKPAGLKKHSVKVQSFLEELVKIDCPGSKAVSEASSKYGPALVYGPITYVFGLVSTFGVTEEKTREVEVVPAAEAEATTVAEATTATTEETSGAEKEIVEEDKPVETEAPTEEAPKTEEVKAEEPAAATA